jgi:predicted hydrocarbon binding protein
MPFHLDRFCLSYKEIVGKDPSTVLGIKLSEYDSLQTPVSRASFIKKLMNTLLAKNSESVARRVMLGCGYMMRDGVSHCINEHKIKRTKMLFEKYKDLKDFLKQLGNQGGGKFRRESNSIIAVYHRCYCGSVSKTRDDIPLAYCYCGAGWYKRLFEEVLGRPVRVEVLQSIANGADRCVLRIHGVR